VESPTPGLARSQSWQTEHQDGRAISTVLSGSAIGDDDLMTIAYLSNRGRVKLAIATAL
jgi:hypothetical protein